MGCRGQDCYLVCSLLQRKQHMRMKPMVLSIVVNHMTDELTNGLFLNLFFLVYLIQVTITDYA